MQPCGVVGLVEPHGHGQLGNARGEPLGARPHAAVVHDGSAARQQGGERNVRLVPCMVGNVARELLWITREQQATPLHDGRRLDRGGEEAAGLTVG